VLTNFFLDVSFEEWTLGFNIQPEELQIHTLIGKGSSGEVFKATWNNYLVCAKVVRAASIKLKKLNNLMTEKKREAFLKETQMLA